MLSKEIIKNIKELKNSNELSIILEIVYEIDVSQVESYDDEKDLFKQLEKVIDLNKTIPFDELLKQAKNMNRTTKHRYRHLLGNKVDNPYITAIFSKILDEEDIKLEIDDSLPIYLKDLLSELIFLKRNQETIPTNESKFLIDIFKDDQAFMLKALITNREFNLEYRNYFNENFLFMASYFDAINIFKLLLECGLSPQEKNSLLETPLHKALQNNSFKIAEYMIKQKLCIDHKDESQNTPLHIAATKSFDLVKLLVDAKAKIHTHNIDRDSPIKLALYFKQFESLAYMMKHTSIYDLDLIFEAAKYNIIEAIEILKSYKGLINYYNKEKLTPLHVAVINNHVTFGEALLKNGADINFVTKKNVTPLYLAVEHQFYSFIDCLLKYQPNPNIVYDKKWTPLYVAIIHKDDELIKSLILAGSDVNIEFDDGFTPLLYSTGNNKLHITELLLQKGAKMNKITKCKVTPLINAIGYGYFEIVKLLIQYGADINKKDSDGLTPIKCAIFEGVEEIAVYLIEKGCDLSDSSLLNLALERHLVQMVVPLLIEKGVQLNIPNKSGLLPIQFAIQNKFNEVAKILIHQGCELKNEYLLMEAFDKRLFDVCELLIEKDVPLNVQNKNGQTPLSKAITYQNKDLAKRLILKGANLNYLIKTNLSSSISNAVVCQLPEIALLLVEKGANVNHSHLDGVTPLHLAVEYNIPRLIKALVEKGAKINVRNKVGFTPLMLAIRLNQFDNSDYLIKNGAKINIKDHEGNSSILIAAKNDQTEMVQLLIKNKANVNEQLKKMKRTALYYALMNNNIELVELLLKSKANVNVRMHSKMTPLHLVLLEETITKKDQLLELLLRFGAKSTLKNKAGESSLQIIKKMNREDFLQLLIQYGVKVKK